MKDSKTWAMFLHFSVFAGYVVPLAGLLAPILIWQLKKNEMPDLDAHGKMVVNFVISMILYALIALVLCFALIGFLLFYPLGLIAIIFPIVGGIKANNGEVWKYPLTIRFIK